MHHEVLLALSGCPGNAFSVSRETGLFEVIPDLPFIHPSEVSLLNRICRLGTYYLQLREFIAEQSATIFNLPTQRADSFDPRRGSSGVYLKALAGGIDMVLDDYRKTLVQVEQKCIQDPHLPLSHLQSSFEEYQFLLPSLDACVKHIHRNKLQGCQILSHLHDLCSSGVPIVQTAYERILCVCHGVLYKQLSAWMLHGLLMDDRGEFFIEAVQEQVPTAEANQEQASGGESQVQKVTPHLNSSTAVDTSRVTINHTLTPSYLPLRVVEKILFVGEAVQIFQSQAHSKQNLSTSLTGAGSQLRADQFRFGRVLVGLQQQPTFQLRDFESAIDSIRDRVAEHLWKLLVEDSNLVGQLQVIKDFFLLGRGELFLALVDLTNSFMSLPPTTATQHDVNIAFRQAMLKVGMESEDLMKQFKLVVTLPPHKGGGAAWSFLGLTQSVEWPLHILFTPSMLEKYNSIFKFLLALRRAQIALQQSWAVLMQYRQRVDELRDVWELRTHMGFLIDNLQYYVQVDVLEAQFSLLLEKVNSTQDFETIKHAHENFVTTLQSQLFFKLPAAAHCLQEIMELCYSFSSLLQWREGLSFSQKDRTQIERTVRDFKRQSSLFFKVVSSVKNHHSAPHLAQLLLRVDYNKFFSTRNPLGTSQHREQ